MGRRLLLAIALVLLLLVLGWGLQHALAPPEEIALPRPDPAPTDAEPEKAIAQQVNGDVLLRRGGGEWVPLHSGDELAADDAIRTGEAGTVVMTLGTDITVQVDPLTEVRVGDIARSASGLDLAGGRINAVVKDSAGGLAPKRLQVTFDGSDATASSGPGEFSAISAGDGHLSVASKSGNVLLHANGKTVTVGPGLESRVEPGLPPSAPEVIPPSLFLKLGAPGATIVKDKQMKVRGDSTPGSLVDVNGVRTVVSADGRFEAVVPLQEGSNKLHVQVRSVDGKTQAGALPEITVDTKPLDVTGKVDWK
jgi:hypothetical protein